MKASLICGNCPDVLGLIGSLSALEEAAAALIRSISAITNSTNSALLALALKRNCLLVNSALSVTLLHANKALIFSTSIPVFAAIS